MAPGLGQMATVNLIGSYNYWLVAISVFIAVFASYAALDLASRVMAASGWTRALWVLGGACAMGTGIWSMHYIGMLAFILPIPVAYHWPTVLLSLFAAILASAIALYVVSRQKMGASQAVAGSLLMGAGIAGMHYIGMAAMRIPAMCQFNSSLVVLSVVFAVLISLAALWITFHFRDEKTGGGRKKLAGAVVMGAAIPVMHYTGMAAASFTSSGMPVDLSNAVSVSALGVAGIIAVTFIVLGLALLTSWVDRRLAVQTFELQQRRNEAYLAEAQRLSHTGSFGWKVSSGDIYWSEETFKIFGCEQAVKPTLQVVFQRMHPDDRDLVQQKIEHAARERTDFDLEHRLLMPDGLVKHLHVLARALETSPGDLEFIGAVTDVTASKQAEMKVRESEAYLAETQRLSHTGSWAWSPPSDDIRYWSEECYRVQGLDPKEGPPKYETFFQTIHPDDQARVGKVIERAVREIEEFEFDYRIVHSDGEIRDARSFGHPVLGPSGDLVEYVGTIIDVTERKQAEDKIRQSEAYLAEAQRLSHTGSWAWNPATGENRYWSDETFRLMGFNPAGGMPAFEAVLQRFHPDDQPEFAEQLERARRERAEFEVDYRIIHPSGEIRNIHAVGHPILGPSGDLVEFVGSVIDVTERKQAEKERERLREAQSELAHASRMTTMGELTASLAHEVNQPITAAVNGASTCVRWLTRDEPDLGEAREAAAGAIRNAKRAADIINRIRAISKKGESKRQLVDVNELIRETVALLQIEAKRYSISVGTDLDADLPRIMADSVQVQQVMMNLIMNGIDAMKDVDQIREIVIRSQRVENQQLMVSISDTGVGLPSQGKDKVFDAFFTTKPQGIGMGLRISRSIVEAHGGRLWAADNSPHGATFSFTFPIPAEAPGVLAKPSDAHTNV